MSVRLVFLGNDPWSVPALEAIAPEADLAVELVLTNPPRPAGRGSALRPTAVATSADALGLPLLEAEGVRSGPGLEAIRALAPDVLVVVAYGQILTGELLAIPRLGALNLHLSLLPRWRGAAPVAHAILAGDAVTGVTVMRMDEGLDTGPILTQLEQPIRPEDDVGTLGARLAKLGAMLLVGVVRSLTRAAPPPRPQDEASVTLAPKLGPLDRIIDWHDESDRITRRVRALSPDPGATTTLRGDPVKVLAATPSAAALDAPPGAIVEADGRGVLVAAGTGGVWIREVAPAGRRRMPAADWANGARFEVGERLG